MSIKNLAEYGIVPTWDLGAIFFLFILVIFYEVSSGKNKTVLSLISAYFSFGVVKFFPFWAWIANATGLNERFYFEVPTFLVLTLVFAFFLSHSVGGSFFSFSKIKLSQFIQAFIFAVLQTGLLSSITLSFLPESYYSGLSPIAVRMFISQPLAFLWILLPIIGLFIFNTRKGRN